MNGKSCRSLRETNIHKTTIALRWPELALAPPTADKNRVLLTVIHTPDIGWSTWATVWNQPLIRGHQFRSATRTPYRKLSTWVTQWSSMHKTTDSCSQTELCAKVWTARAQKDPKKEELRSKGVRHSSFKPLKMCSRAAHQQRVCVVRCHKAGKFNEVCHSPFYYSHNNAAES